MLFHSKRRNIILWVLCIVDMGRARVCQIFFWLDYRPANKKIAVFIAVSRINIFLWQANHVYQQANIWNFYLMRYYFRLNRRIAINYNVAKIVSGFTSPSKDFLNFPSWSYTKMEGRFRT